jgi:hypothetical protein
MGSCRFDPPGDRPNSNSSSSRVENFDYSLKNDCPSPLQPQPQQCDRLQSFCGISYRKDNSYASFDTVTDCVLGWAGGC